MEKTTEKAPAETAKKAASKKSIKPAAKATPVNGKKLSQIDGAIKVLA